VSSRQLFSHKPTIGTTFIFFTTNNLSLEQVVKYIWKKLCPSIYPKKLTHRPKNEIV